MCVNGRGWRFRFAIFLLLCGIVAARAGDLRFGLVSYWPFDVQTNGMTPDISFGNHLVVHGRCASVPGPFGNALSFDGSSQYAEVTHGADSSLNGLPIHESSGGYTVALWVKGPPDQVDKYLFAEASTNNSTPLFLIQTRNNFSNDPPGKLDVFLRTSGSTTLLNHVHSASTVFDNTWHHIAWVDDHGAVRLYVDGRLDAAKFNYVFTPGALTLNTTSVGALVRKNVSGFFQGAIDSVAVWERVLSQAEVQSLMTNAIPTPIPPILPGGLPMPAENITTPK